MVLNALAAAGVGIKFGLTVQEIKQGIASVKSVSGRSNVLSGFNGSSITHHNNR